MLACPRSEELWSFKKVDGKSRVPRTTQNPAPTDQRTFDKTPRDLQISACLASNQSICIPICTQKITLARTKLPGSDWSILLSNATACEEVMNALDECHARGFLWKAVGMCNDAKTQVNKCLRAQRLERTKQNREKAKPKNDAIRAKWAEIDAES
jgi:COX assembly protein 2